MAEEYFSGISVNLSEAGWDGIKRVRPIRVQASVFLLLAPTAPVAPVPVAPPLGDLSNLSHSLLCRSVYFDSPLILPTPTPKCSSTPSAPPSAPPSSRPRVLPPSLVSMACSSTQTLSLLHRLSPSAI